MPSPGRYVVIGGHGRSGSNLIMDMLDVHRATHCRNEPNELAGAALAGLPPFFAHEIGDDFPQVWSRAVAAAAPRVGTRDRLPVSDKRFVRPHAPARAAAWIESKSRLRWTIGATGDEWPAPAVIYDRAHLKAALPVFKILLGPAGLAAAHASDPALHLVHVLRRPEAFLNSWYNRYVLGPGGGPERVWRANLETLPVILQHFGAAPDRCAAFDRAALLESELWRWRYLNEVLHGLTGGPRYFLAPYEQAKSDPDGMARALADFAGLDYRAAETRKVAGLENRLFAKPHSEALPASEIDVALAGALAGTTLPL